MARVLIIDDDPNIRLLARKVLGSLGITVLEAQDGAEGLSLTVNRDPDLILCDVMMPVMDGMEFLREWASREAIAHIPVIMVTSVSEKGRIIDAVKLGACDYIVKPFDPLGFRTKVNKLLREAAARQTTSGGAPAAGPRTARPVVVAAHEDEAVRRLAAEALGADYEVVTAADGAECLHVVAERRPDVLLVGAGLPVIECDRLLARIKEGGGAEGMRVVLLASGEEASAFDETVRPMLAGTVEPPAEAAALRAAVDGALGRDRYYFYEQGETTVLRFKAGGLAAAAGDGEAFRKWCRSELLEMCDAGRKTMEVDLRTIGGEEAGHAPLLKRVGEQAGSCGVSVLFKVSRGAEVEALEAVGIEREQVCLEEASVSGCSN